jgi:hypothetical protein
VCACVVRQCTVSTAVGVISPSLAPPVWPVCICWQGFLCIWDFCPAQEWFFQLSMLLHFWWCDALLWGCLLLTRCSWSPSRLPGLPSASSLSLLQLQADDVYNPATHDFHGAGLPATTTSQVALVTAGVPAGVASDSAGGSGSSRNPAQVPEAEVVQPGGHLNKV